MLFKYTLVQILETRDSVREGVKASSDLVRPICYAYVHSIRAWRVLVHA